MIKAAVIVMVVTLVTAALARAGRKPATVDHLTNAHVLTYSRLYKAFGWLFGVCPAIAVAVLATVWPPKNQGDWNAVCGMIVGFGGLGIAIINESRTQIRLDGEGMHALSPWRGKTDISWRSITRVQFSQSAQRFIIRDDTGRVIRAHAYLKGISTLLSRFRDHLPADLYAEARRAYEARSRRAP
jgi:hypothetical protein